MKKIKFVNNSAPDISAENLNEIQDNVEKEFYKHTISNIETLRTLNLSENDKVETLGYYEKFDGGASEYEIVNDSELVEDGSFVIELDNGLKAKLIIPNDNTISIKQLGAKSYDGEKYDIQPYLYNYQEYLDKQFIKLYIPNGVWHCSPFNWIKSFSLIGNKAFVEGDENNHTNTYITSLEDNQEYVFFIGDVSDIPSFYVDDFSIDNIIISSGEAEVKENGYKIGYKTGKKLSDCAVHMKYCNKVDFGKISFENIIGPALKICSCWEINIDKLFLSKVSNLEGSLVIFETADKQLNPVANVSDIVINYVKCEQNIGSIFNLQPYNALVHLDINNIHYESNRLGMSYNDTVITGANYITFTPEILSTWNDETAIHESLFMIDSNADSTGITINSINLNNFAFRYLNYNNKKYVFDSLFYFKGNNALADILVSNINVKGMNKEGKLVYSRNPQLIDTNITIDNILNSSLYSFMFDVVKFPFIRCKENLFNVINSNNHKDSNINLFVDTFSQSRDNARGLITYDSKAYNNKKLVLNPLKPSEVGGRVFLNGILTHKYLNIYASVKSGITKTLTVTANTATGVTRYLTFELVGTGEYKMYQLQVVGNSNVGYGLPFSLTVSSTDGGDENANLDFWFLTDTAIQ